MRIEVTRNNLRKIIDAYCKENNITLTKIAQQLEISPQRLDQLCNAKDMVVSNAILLSVFLGCDLNAIFSYKIKNK